MVVRSAMMVSLIGRACMACSSASFATPPFHMTVILVVGAVLDVGEALRPRFFGLGGVVVLAAVAVYRDWVLIHGCGAGAVLFVVVVLLPAFRAASAGVGSGRGGMGGGGRDVAGGGAVCGAGVAFVVFGVGVLAGCTIVTSCSGARRGGAGFFVGAGRITRGSLATGGLDARGIWGGLVGARAVGAVLPCSMAFKQDSKLSKRSVRRPIPSMNILMKAGCDSVVSCGWADVMGV